MAAAETALSSISTLATLGQFLDTQEDFPKVGPVGGRWSCCDLGHSAWGPCFYLTFSILLCSGFSLVGGVSVVWGTVLRI